MLPLNRQLPQWDNPQQELPFPPASLPIPRRPPLPLERRNPAHRSLLLLQILLENHLRLTVFSDQP